MAEAEPKAAEPKVKILRRTAISPQYIKAGAEITPGSSSILYRDCRAL